MRGSNLKKRRIELGLTLEEVGNIVGVGKSTVRKWETGSIENMKRDKIALLAKALQTTPLFIMGVEETEPSTIVEFKDFEIKLIEKYRELDEKGKHTVNTVLNMEYNRLRKSHLEVVAAHTDDYSEDQIKLMKQDLEEL
jgi:transcriptional regulator with XRE-family HTH domain